MKPPTISTSAHLSTLRPKNMAELYSSQVTYLLRNGDICHLVFGVTDWAATAACFGEAIAFFNPFEKRWYTYDGITLTQAELRALVGSGEVCMGGKDCPKHRKEG